MDTDNTTVVHLPIRVQEKEVWLLTEDERRTVGVTLVREPLFGRVYDLYYLNGRRIGPEDRVLVPVGFPLDGSAA